MKLYTKTGDKGQTSLADSSRVAKSDTRICALGELDEVNATLGWLACEVKDTEVLGLLVQAQSRLFDCGAVLAGADSTATHLNLPTSEFIKQYEQSIDAFSASLPALTGFILPGGSEVAARAHVARSVVRRAERSLVALQHNDIDVDPAILMFVNRLSDWLFALARWSNAQEGVGDVPWRKLEG